MTGTELASFRALSFQRERVGDPGAVWAPPYDVVAPETAAQLRDSHPHNIVRITNPEEGRDRQRYVQAARELESWIAAGVLAREERAAVYVHRHSFRRGRDSAARTGVWALLRLVPFDAGVVLPHERTMSGPKADRLALMRACRAQLSPVFFICSDPDGAIAGLLADLSRAAPLERCEFPTGQRHEVWRVGERDAIAALAREVRAQVLLIADGHHRYETALAYRDELGAAGAPLTGRRAHEYVLAYVVPESDPGLQLLPTHRLLAGEPLDWERAVQRAGRRFDVVRLGEDDPRSLEAMLEEEAGGPGFVLVVGTEPGGWLLRSREPGLESSISSVAFHDVFMADAFGLSLEDQIGRTTFVKEGAAAVAAVRAGQAQAAALLAAPRVAQVREAARAGRRLPPKTTYFWPKVPTGVAIHVIDPEEEVGGDPLEEGRGGAADSSGRA